jgi:hypothetical protein
MLDGLFFYNFNYGSPFGYKVDIFHTPLLPPPNGYLAGTIPLEPVMSPIPDSPLIASTWHSRGKHSNSHTVTKDAPRNGHRPRFILDPVPSLASVVRGSLSWAGSICNSEDIVSRKKRGFEEELHSETEGRKQVLYLRMRNVSLFRAYCSVTLLSPR